MLLLDLPIELLSFILQQLSVLDILSCRVTGRRLREIIDFSIAIQYNLELYASGKLDNPHCTLTRSSKLQELQRLNVSWESLHWSHRAKPIPIRNFAAVYELSGGYFFQDLNPGFPLFNTDAHNSTLSWLQLPSSRDALGAKWKDTAFDFKVADLCLDIDRDLLAVVERTDSNSGASWSIGCTVHLRTISTNVSHPDAAKPELCIRFHSSLNDYAMIVQLSGDYLAILLTARRLHPDRLDLFYLWNWTTGECIVNMKSEEEAWDTFCFISSHAILIPDTNFCSLNIYLFDDKPSSFRHAVSLLLPEAINTPAIAHIYCRTEPSSNSFLATPKKGSRKRDQDQKPFKTDPNSSIIILTFDYIIAPPINQAQIFIDGFALSMAQPQVVAMKRSTLLGYAFKAESTATKMMARMQKQDHEFKSATFGAEANGNSLHTPGTVRAPPFASNSNGLITSELSLSSAVTAPTLAPYDASNKFGDKIRKRIPHMHAEHWIHTTRWGLSSVPSRWVCYAHGSRFVSMEDREMGSQGRMGFTVYDFNMKLFRKRLYSSAFDSDGYDSLSESSSQRSENTVESRDNEDEREDDRWPVRRTQIVDQPTTINLPEIFKNEFRTALPYVVTQTRKAFDWDSVMIDDEHIIGLKEDSDTGGLELLDVLVM